MPHVALVPFTGLRVKEREMAALGMALPGLRERAGAIARLPALGLLTLAGMTPEHWTISYHEADADLESLAEVVLSHRPAVVAVSALTASIIEAYSFCAMIRERGVRVVIGGLHVTAMPHEALRHADAVVAGDGEPVWLDVLRDAERGVMKGIYQASQPMNLAEAPLPRIDLLGPGRRQRYTVQTQRGCPLACEFCAASRLLGPFREKPVEQVRRELEAITARVPRAAVELADDNTFAGRRDAAAMLDALAESNVRWFTEADWRIGERPDVLARLADSGCVQVLVGFESMVFQHAGMGAKGVELARVMNAVAAIQESGVAVIGCCIIGSDGETHESLDRLGAFLHDAPLADVQLTVLTPFPGTALHRRLKASGRLRAECDWSHATLFDVMFEPTHMSAAELQRRYYELVRDTFAAEPSARRERLRWHIWSRRDRSESCASAPLQDS